MRIVALLWAYHLGARAIIQKQENDLVPLQAVEDAKWEQSTTGAPVLAEEAQNQNLHNTSADPDEIYESRPDIIVRNLAGGGTLRKKAGGTAQFGKHGAAHLVRKIEGESEDEFLARRTYFSSMAESAEHSTTLEVVSSTGQGTFITTHSECAAENECKTRWNVCFLPQAPIKNVEACALAIIVGLPTPDGGQMVLEGLNDLNHGKCYQLHALTEEVAEVVLEACAGVVMNYIEEDAPMEVISHIMAPLQEQPAMDPRQPLWDGRYETIALDHHMERRTIIPGLGGSQTKVQLIDSGCDCGHIEFRDASGQQTRVVVEQAAVLAVNGFDVEMVKCSAGWESDTCSVDPRCDDGMGHGTHMALAIAGKSNGVAPKATLTCHKAVNNAGQGSIGTTVSVLRDLCVDPSHLLEDSPNQVIVLGLQGIGDSPQISDLITMCMEDQNHLVVVAAGQEMQQSPADHSCQYTLANTKALTVGALYFPPNQDGRSVSAELARFTTHGACVNIYAPAVNIPIVTGDRVSQLSGTTLAAANVAGVAALLLDKQPQMPVRVLQKKLMCSATYSGIRTREEPSDSEGEQMLENARSEFGLYAAHFQENVGPDECNWDGSGFDDRGVTNPIPHSPSPKEYVRNQISGIFQDWERHALNAFGLEVR